jgi:hypothetical protein
MDVAKEEQSHLDADVARKPQAPPEAPKIHRQGCNATQGATVAPNRAAVDPTPITTRSPTFLETT